MDQSRKFVAVDFKNDYNFKIKFLTLCNNNNVNSLSLFPMSSLASSFNNCIVVV